MRRRQRKKLHRKYIPDLRYEISVSKYWRTKLMFLPPNQPVRITVEELRESQIAQKWVPAFRYSLRYSVSVRPLANGLVEFDFYATEFPAVTSWSHNNPESL